MSNFVPPPQRAHLKWAAVDFDGTIAESNWSPDNPNATPGNLIEATAEEMERIIKDEDMKNVVHTSRGWADYEIIEKYLRHHGVPFHKIVCGKLLARVYVDDRNAMLGTKWV